MNSKYFTIRTDRNTGDLWLTYEKPRERMKRLLKITDQVLLCLAADLSTEEGIKVVEREIKYNDGSVVKLTVEDMGIPDAQPA